MNKKSPRFTNSRLDCRIRASIADTADKGLKLSLIPRAAFQIGAFIAAGAAFCTSLAAQEILFQDKFEQYELETAPTEISEGGIWEMAREGSNAGAVQVLEDTEDVFGYGTANRYLRIENGIGFLFAALNVSDAEVVTMSFDFVDRRTTISSSGSERLTVQFLAGDGSHSNINRAHIFSLQGGSEIRPNAGSYDANTRLRFDVILNNSAEEIEYESPTGLKKLAPGLADVWKDGVIAAQNYSFARDSAMTASPVRSFAFQTFSTDRFSADLDNFTIFAGAHVLPEIATASEAGDGTLIELSKVFPRRG